MAIVHFDPKIARGSDSVRVTRNNRYTQIRQEIRKKEKGKKGTQINSGNVRLKQCTADTWIMVWQVIESGEDKIFFFRLEFVLYAPVL